MSDTPKTKSGFSLRSPGMSKFLEAYGIVLVVVVMMAVLAAIKPEVFLSAQNLTNIIKQTGIEAN